MIFLFAFCVLLAALIIHAVWPKKETTVLVEVERTGEPEWNWPRPEGHEEVGRRAA